MSERSHRIGTFLVLDAGDHRQLYSIDEPEQEVAVESKQEIFLPLIEEHGGRCSYSVGNKAIAEFSNAVETLHAAVEIQQAMLGENRKLPLEQRVLLRIGLHVGNVSEENGNVSGDGIDTAVGLVELAVPGGICLSGSVYEQVKHKGHVGVEFAGEKNLKNISGPVRIYQVVEPGVEKGRLTIWRELQRRNVFRVSVAYAVVAWLMIQVADVILPTFDTDPWVMRLLITVVILGFPVVVVLAWVYELTPVGLRRSDDVLRQTSIRWLTGRRLDGVIISLLVMAVVFLVYENYLSKGLTEFDKSKPVSVAVLAFENQSVNASDKYFADGLADELLSALGRIHELKVASRTASFYFKGKDIDIDTIASTLMVDNVLSGSVRREGERVRITAVLDDTVYDELVWSKTYDRKLEDILNVQSDIAQLVTNAIVPVLSPESKNRIQAKPTEKPEAYQFYLRGRDYLRQPAEKLTLSGATILFNRAIEIDGRFAQAYAGLCEAQLGNYEFTKETESFEAAERACQRALSLDDGLWEVHVALGNLYRTNGQYDTARLELEAAIDQQPNAVSSYVALAETYAAQNRLELAEATFREAEEVDPAYWGVHRAFGNFLYDLSRYEEAIQRHIRVTELVPDSGIGYDNLGNTYLAIGALELAEKAFNASPLPSRWTYTNRGLVYYYRGEFQKAADDYKRSIELAPEIHSTWGFLADAYRFVAGEEKHSRDAYEKAIQLAERDLMINPTNWRTIGQLGMYYAYTGRPEEATSQVKTLLELTTESTAYYYATRVLSYLGDMEGGFDALERTVAAGWSRALLAKDPDVVALQGEDGYAALLAEPSG